MTWRVERATTLPPGFPALRETALVEGWRMLRVLEEDWESGVLRFDHPGEALLAGWEEGELAGIAWLSRDPYAEQPGIARLRRLYVAPRYRGRGLGRALVEAAAGMATEFGYRLIRVRSPAAARRFYEACGFLPAVVRSATHIRPL